MVLSFWRPTVFSSRQSFFQSCILPRSHGLSLSEVNAEFDPIESLGWNPFCTSGFYDLVWGHSRTPFSWTSPIPVTLLREVIVSTNDRLSSPSSCSFSGDLYFEKAVNGFLADLFTKWKVWFLLCTQSHWANVFKCRFKKHTISTKLHFIEVS